MTVTRQIHYSKWMNKNVKHKKNDSNVAWPFLLSPALTHAYDTANFILLKVQSYFFNKNYILEIIMRVPCKWLYRMKQ